MKNTDPVLWMLLAAFLVTLGATIFVAKMLPNDGQTFQVLANLSTGWASGFLLRVKPQTNEQEKPLGASLTETKTTVLKDPAPETPKSAA